VLCLLTVLCLAVLSCTGRSAARFWFGCLCVGCGKHAAVDYHWCSWCSWRLPFCYCLLAAASVALCWGGMSSQEGCYPALLARALASPLHCAPTSPTPLPRPGHRAAHTRSLLTLALCSHSLFALQYLRRQHFADVTEIFRQVRRQPARWSWARIQPPTLLLPWPGCTSAQPGSPAPLPLLCYWCNKLPARGRATPSLALLIGM